MKTELTWPLFWCLTPADQAVLMKYQYDTYGFHLDIPPMSVHGVRPKQVEPLEELERMMKRPPPYREEEPV